MAKEKSKNQQPKASRFLLNKVAFLNCYENLGMIETVPHVFTRAYEIKVPNKEMKTEYDLNHIRECMKEILGTFVQNYTIQIMVQNSKIEKEQYLDRILLQPYKEREINLCIEDYNEIIKDNIDIGHNNYKRTVLFIISTFQPSADKALEAFALVDAEVKELFGKMYEYIAEPLSLDERLWGLRLLFNPEDSTTLNDFIELRDSNRKTPVKQLIYPHSYRARERDYMKVGNKFVRNLFINSLPSSVPDSVLNDIMSVSANSILSIIYEPLNTDFAQQTSEELVKKNTDIKEIAIRDTVEDRKARRTQIKEKPIKEGEKQYFQKEAFKFLKEAKEKGESVMLASFIISLFADSKEDLDRDTKLLKLSASKYASQIRCCDLNQDEAYQSVLPLGYSRLNIYRAFTSGQLAAIQPLDIQQLFNKQKAFLGLNEISDNLILMDRKTFPTGLICGAEHSGKTFQMKREIANTLMTTEDEVILITRDANPYQKFAKNLGGKFLDQWSPDIFFSCNKKMKKLALSAFVAARNQITKMHFSASEKLELFEAIETEAEDLSSCRSWNEAVQRINKDKISYQSVIKALKGYKPLISMDFDSIAGRFKIVEVDTEPELICSMKSAYEYVMRKNSEGKTVWVFIDGVESLFYTQPSSDFLIGFLKELAETKAPLTMVVQDSVRVIANADASIEYDYFLTLINYFKLMTQGPIERRKYIDKLNISESLIPYITDREPGEGIIITPSSDVAFNDRFESKDNPFYARFYN
jgi:hypothetical protein